MYKMIVIDVDGTLVNSYSEISQYTKDILRQAQDKGIFIVIASGRVSTSTETFAKEIGLNGYIISCNGSVITDLQTGKTIFSKCMDLSKAKEVVQLCLDNSINCNLYTLNEVLATKIEHSALFYSIANKKLPEERRTKIVIVNDLIKSLMNPENKYITKITVSDKDRSIFRSIIRKLRDLGGLTVLEVSHSSNKKIRVGTEDAEINYYYTEVTKENVDKWEAIEFLANKLNIKPEEIMTFGDNINDVNMVQKAGFGVMMENASPVYQKYADYIAPSNNNDGVAKVVKEFILDKLS